jgi:hypothetical protein
MIYYAFEALLVSLFISFVWKFFLSQYFGEIGYIQIVTIYWIFKMLMFDVFKLINGLNSAGSNMLNETEKQNNEFDNNN